MISKDDAVKLMKIEGKIITIITDYNQSVITLGEFDELLQAQIKITYELGKSSK